MQFQALRNACVPQLCWRWLSDWKRTGEGRMHHLVAKGRKPRLKPMLAGLAVVVRDDGHRLEGRASWGHSRAARMARLEWNNAAERQDWPGFGTWIFRWPRKPWSRAEKRACVIRTGRLASTAGCCKLLLVESVGKHPCGLLVGNAAAGHGKFNVGREGTTVEQIVEDVVSRVSGHCGLSACKVTPVE